MSAEHILAVLARHGVAAPYVAVGKRLHHRLASLGVFGGLVALARFGRQLRHYPVGHGGYVGVVWVGVAPGVVRVFRPVEGQRILLVAQQLHLLLYPVGGPLHVGPQPEEALAVARGAVSLVYRDDEATVQVDPLLYVAVVAVLGVVPSHERRPLLPLAAHVHEVHVVVNLPVLHLRARPILQFAPATSGPWCGSMSTALRQRPRARHACTLS